MTWLNAPTKIKLVSEESIKPAPVLSTFGQPTTAQLQKEADRLSSFGGLLTETVKETGRRLLQIPIEIAKNTWEVYKHTPDKLVEDVQDAAIDLGKGKILKGLAKAGFRTAGDAAIAIFAPLSSAIGAVLGATEGQKLIDKAGQVIADKSGITDVPAFQRFAMSHPNAEEDFERLLMLSLVGAEKGKIEPKRMVKEVKTLAKKIVEQARKIEPEVKPEIVSERPAPVLETFRAEVPAEAIPEGITEQFPTQRKAGLAESLKEEARLRDYTENLGESPIYETRSLGNALERARSFVERDPILAEQIIRGERTAPPEFDLFHSEIYSAIKEKAFKEGDVATLYKLATDKKISAMGTEAGRIVKGYDVGLRNDPVIAMKEVAEARQKGLEMKKSNLFKSAKIEKIKANEINKAKVEIRKATPKIKTWEEFIKTLQC